MCGEGVGLDRRILAAVGFIVVALVVWWLVARP